MSLIRRLWGGILPLLSAMAWLLPGPAHADESNLAPEDDLAPAPSTTAADTSAKRSLSVSGLVPLKELNRQPYAGVWFADFRFHNLELGLASQTASLDGSLHGSDDNPQVIGGLAQQDVSGSLQYISFSGAYYVPLVGYTPEFSIGLLPMLRLGAGGFYSGSSSSTLDGRSESKIGTVIELPVFAMARLGRNASRYAAWDVSLGAGVGVSVIDFSAGDPIVNSAGYAAPAVRLEAAYSFFQVGYEMALSSHDKALGGADHLAYRVHSFTLGFVWQPPADD